MKIKKIKIISLILLLFTVLIGFKNQTNAATEISKADVKRRSRCRTAYSIHV